TNSRHDLTVNAPRLPLRSFEVLFQEIRPAGFVSKLQKPVRRQIMPISRIDDVGPWKVDRQPMRMLKPRPAVGRNNHDTLDGVLSSLRSPMQVVTFRKSHFDFPKKTQGVRVFFAFVGLGPPMGHQDSLAS